ncbi:hypothetical protein D3C73_1444720 [compost metagenome]
MIFEPSAKFRVVTGRPAVSEMFFPLTELMNVMCAAYPRASQEAFNCSIALFILAGLCSASYTVAGTGLSAVGAASARRTRAVPIACWGSLHVFDARS